MRILVVDDYESMRKLVIKNLNQMGYTHISQAANGQEALRVLENNPTIGLILTDWNMPVMTGIDLLRAVRLHPKFCGLPVLMITAEIARHQVQEAAEAGVSDFLVKPFTVGGLQGKFDKILVGIKAGKVVGTAGNSRITDRSDDLHGALFQRRNTPPAAQPAVKSDHHSAHTATEFNRSSPAVAHQPSAGTQPLALVITEDLQAKMTKRASILVVDDIADNIDVLVGLLQEEYKVRASKSGAAALHMLETSVKAHQPLPDLILLDVMMPEMDGFEVCRRLKANPNLVHIPVIFLSAADDVEHVTEGLSLGAEDYVTKPANPAVLRARVKTHLVRTQALTELRKQNQLLEENMRLREEVEQIGRHDLKNPVGGIMNFADLLLAEGGLSHDQRDIVQTISESARLVLDMVSLSLDLARIEQGTYELQQTPVDLVGIIKKTVSDKTAEIDAKKLKVNHVGEGFIGGADVIQTFNVLGDEILCYSMFGNIVKNAVEAAPEGSDLTISYVKNNGKGSVSITNSGVVPPAIRGSFFDKFVTAGKKGGTGVGTYSAKLLAEVQFGRISMSSSDETRRTTISVELPA